MAEFEELRLTVNLVDNASAGLQRLRGEIAQLTQSTGQMTTSFAQASSSMTRFTGEAQRTGSGVRTLGTEMRSLEQSAGQLGQGLSRLARGFQYGFSGLPLMGQGVLAIANGVSGLNTSLKEVAPAARIASLAFAGLAVGIVAVGAAAVAYGVMVFRFAREMHQLNLTAKALGTNFGELKAATEHVKRFGFAAEVAIQNAAGLQKAQTDLADNGSRLRQSLLGKGLDPQWLKQFSQETEAWRANNMAREKAIAIQNELMSKGWSKRAARGKANEFLAELGLDPGIIERNPERARTAAEMAELDRIAELSGQVNEIWGEIKEKLNTLSLEVLSAGLPLVRDALKDVDGIIVSIKRELASLGELWKGLKDLFNDPLGFAKNVWKETLEKSPLLGGTKPPAVQKQSWQGGGIDSTNPLFQRASFTTEELVDETGRNASETEKLRIQLEKLNEFFDRMSGGGGTGGGVVRASYSPDGGRAGDFRSGGGFTLQPNGSDVGPGTGAGAGLTPSPKGGTGGGRVASLDPSSGVSPPAVSGSPGSGGGVAMPGVTRGGGAGITAPAGTAIARKGLATVTTSTGRKFQVDERFAANFQGFITDYEKAGGLIGPESGTLGHRPHNSSGHPIGAAIDINQVGYGIRGRGGRTLPADVENGLAEKWGLVTGDKWRRKDTGHFGIKSLEAARQALERNIDRSAIDRSVIDRQNGGGAIRSTGQLNVNVKAPPGTAVDYSGNNLLRETSMERQTQMPETSRGPRVAEEMAY